VRVCTDSNPQSLVWETQFDLVVGNEDLKMTIEVLYLVHDDVHIGSHHYRGVLIFFPHTDKREKKICEEQK
jgi:hypothetical protein